MRVVRRVGTLIIGRPGVDLFGVRFVDEEIMKTSKSKQWKLLFAQLETHQKTNKKYKKTRIKNEK